jgi:hypothetical protein
MRLLSLFPLFRRFPAEVIAVTEVIGYRSSPAAMVGDMVAVLANCNPEIPHTGGHF